MNDILPITLYVVGILLFYFLLLWGLRISMAGLIPEYEMGPMGLLFGYTLILVGGVGFGLLFHLLIGLF